MGIDGNGIGWIMLLAIAVMLVRPGDNVADDRVGEVVAKAGNVDTQVTDELKLATEAFYEAYSKRDIWSMSQLWSKDDAVSAIFPAHDKPYFRWDSVRMSWRHTFDHNRDIKIKSLAGLIEAPQGDEDRSIAWIIDSTQFQSFQTQTGQPVLMPNVLTTKIYQRRDGKWLLLHYHAHLPHFVPPMASGEGAEVAALRPPSDTAPDVRAADYRFYKAFRDADVSAMSKAWQKSGDVTAIQPDGDVPFVGLKSVLASWHAIFEHNHKIKVDRVSDAIRVAGNFAWTVGSFEFEAVRLKTGEPVHMPHVLVTKIFRKRGDDWLLVHYHAHIGPLEHTDSQ